MSLCFCTYTDACHPAHALERLPIGHPSLSSVGLYALSFFKDVQFLLIGPLWLLAAAYRRFGLPY